MKIKKIKLYEFDGKTFLKIYYGFWARKADAKFLDNSDPGRTWWSLGDPAHILKYCAFPDSQTANRQFEAHKAHLAKMETLSSLLS